MSFSRPQSKPPTLEQARFAATLLNIPLEGMTEATIRAAFREKVKAAHPDSLMQYVDDAPSALTAVKGARNTLMEWLESLPDDSCRLCRGSGYIRSGGFGASKLCPSCYP